MGPYAEKNLFYVVLPYKHVKTVKRLAPINCYYQANGVNFK